MLDSRSRSLNLLAMLEAALGAAVAGVVFALYFFAPDTLSNPTLALTSAVLGIVAVLYFFTVHHFMQQRGRLDMSALIMSVITIIYGLIIISTTGGLDSPFYSLWLLAIVAAGIFGMTETITLLIITVLYYIYVLVAQGANAPYIRDHIIQFAITLAAAGLAEWVHVRNRKANMANRKLETLSGQLSTEQLKADAIMSSIGEGVMVVDGSRRIQLFNKAAQNLTGWDESSAQGIDYNLVLQLKTDKDEAVSDSNDPFVEAWKKKAEVVRDTLVMTTRGGHKVQLNISISPIFDSNNQPNGAIALFRDISKEKEVERQKDEFVSTASHEMRTPVAAIEGYISLAMNANVATIDDRAMKYLTKAHETIAHLGELFRDLLSVTKAEEQSLGGHMEAVDIGHLVQSVVDDMQFTVQKKQLTLVYQIGDQGGKAISPLYYVAANPERLREVIMNLIDNANKFTMEGGIKVNLSGNEKEVTIGVADSGVGIAQEDIGHLFQKFYRIDNSATRTIGGTGLGLYLCRRVIEAFNGRIWVESKAGVGSVFKFTLPRLSLAEVERMQQASVAAQAAPAADGQATAAGAEPAAATPSAVPVTAAVTPEPAPAPTPVIDATPSLSMSPAPAARVYRTDISRRVR